MSSLAPKIYADWRCKHSRPAFFGETDLPVPERFLQNVWHHQRLLREKLRTLDGQPVRVLHPGFWNREAGPDFRGAVVQFGHERARSGDIEIDLHSAGWRTHGHDRNPNFANVVLHVVWEPDDVAKIPCPTLALEPFLDSSVSELTQWLGSETTKAWPTDLSGRCCAPLGELAEEKLDELLQQAADVRLQRKGEEFQARARQSGWEQALWEGIFRALGYKQNVWPMQRLAELISEPAGRAGKAGKREFPAQRSALAWQARLLGMSGLLPGQPEEAEDESYLRAIWDIWWRERDEAGDLALPKSLWRFNGIRPANFPQRRIALASHWLADKNFFANLEAWFMTDHDESPRLNSLLKFFQVEEDNFWSWHWTFRSARLAKPQPLIGAQRVSELAINVILPWFWMRAVVGKNLELKRRAEQIYFAWPAVGDNSVLRLARQRLLGGRSPRRMRTAAAQQGLLQIVRDFCEHSNAICADCRFPGLVRSLRLP
ncbi:MAG: DUF2851 family protein, partial [Verrucomicrobiota bacterium]